MTSAPRNGRAAAGHIVAAAATIVYTVPPQSNFLLKSVMWRNEAGTYPTTVQLYLGFAGTNYVAIISQPLNAPDAIVWSGWTALNAGDTLTLYSTTGSGFYWIAGATLPAIPGFAEIVVHELPPTPIDPAAVQNVLYLPANTAPTLLSSPP